MRRHHLFELMDQPWCPRVFRRYATDYLHAVVTRLGIFDGMAPHLARVLRATGHRRIIDLCSGSSGPMPRLRRLLADEHGLEVEVLLTDKYPAEAPAGEAVEYVRSPVDATAVPRALSGMRTLFNGFHHFPPEQARQILRDARDARVPIGVFEMVHRYPGEVLSTALLPLTVWLQSPRIRPVSAGRLLWTYVLPVVPLLVGWDGFVSHLRAYTPGELAAMGRELETEAYRWEVGETRRGGRPGVGYLLGYPV